MRLSDKAYLVWLNQKPVLLIGGLFNIGAALLIASVDAMYSSFVIAFIFKVPLMALAVFLQHTFASRDRDVFFVNLGFGRRRMCILGLVIDFVCFILPCVLIMLLR